MANNVATVILVIVVGAVVLTMMGVDIPGMLNAVFTGQPYTAATGTDGTTTPPVTPPTTPDRVNMTQYFMDHATPAKMANFEWTCRTEAAARSGDPNMFFTAYTNTEDELSCNFGVGTFNETLVCTAHGFDIVSVHCLAIGAEWTCDSNPPNSYIGCKYN